MKLLTQEIIDNLRHHPFGSSDDGASIFDHEVVVKFFSPVGAATWLILEGEQQENGDWLLWGAATLGYGYEFGYVSLNELKSVRLPFGLSIERDMHIGKHPKLSNFISKQDMM